jgi:hypothetical protein
MPFPEELELPSIIQEDDENHIEMHNRLLEIIYKLEKEVGVVKGRDILRSEWSIIERLYLIEKDIKELQNIKKWVIDSQQNMMTNIKQYIDNIYKQK